MVAVSLVPTWGPRRCSCSLYGPPSPAGSRLVLLAVRRAPYAIKCTANELFQRSQVNGAACAEICYTTELTGFLPGGTGTCSCSGSGASRTGSGGCQCGSCYDQSNGSILGFAVNEDGTCTYGVNCGAVELPAKTK